MDHYFAVSCGIAASVGAISHILYFVRGEHHQHTLLFLQIIFYGFLPLSFTFALLLQIHYAQAMQLGGMLIGSYLTGLWLSMLIYRSLFHRLKSFPGPRLATLSKFYQLFSGLRLDAFRRSHEAHQKYGNFVRTGRLILDLKFWFVCCPPQRFWVSPLIPLYQEVRTGIAKVSSLSNIALYANAENGCQKRLSCL